MIKAFSIERSHAKNGSSVTVHSGMMDLARSIEQKQGEYERAASLFQDAAEIFGIAKGNNGAEYADYLRELAGIYSRKGDYSNAEKTYQKAIDVYENVSNASSLYLIRCHNELSLLLIDKGDFQFAEKNIREVLSVYKDDYKKFLEIPEAICILARVLQSMGDNKQAERFYDEALTLFESIVGGAIHQDIASALNNKSSLMREMGEYDAAERYCRSALEMCRKLPGQPNISYSLIELGIILIKRSKALAAEPILREGVEILKKKLHMDHWQTAYAECVLGNCLTALKRYEEAEHLLLKNYRIINSNRGIFHTKTQEVIKYIIELYEAWEKSEKAAECRTFLKDKEVKK